MEQLSEELVEETWQEVALFSPSRGAEEMIKIGKKQPDLLAFMVSFSEELEEQAKELALYMFLVVYRIFEKGHKKKIKVLKAKEIIKFYDGNETLIEKLEHAHEKFYDRITRIQISHQPYVIKYVVDTLFEESEDKNDSLCLTEEDTGAIFLMLKTVIDALDKKTSG